MLLKKLKNLRREAGIDFSKIYLSLAVFWFSIRVIPKPSRAAYPCQRATLGLVSVKLAIAFSAVLLSTTSLFNRKSVKALSMLTLVGVLLWDPLVTAYYQYNFANSGVERLTMSSLVYGFPSNKVVRVHDGFATNWDFSTGYYWQYVNQTSVDQMVDEGVKALTGNSTAQAAWQTILTNYVSGDIIGIKINGNDFEPFYASELSYVNSIPQLINAVIKGVKSIGVPESSIWVIEPTGSGGRRFYQYYYDKINLLYPQVLLLDSDDITFGNNPELLVNFNGPSPQPITDQMAQIDHLIILPIMKAITPAWGITGTIKMMQGNIQSQSGLHSQLTLTTPDNPDVLIYQNPHIVGKTRLIVGDGLFGMWTGIHFEEGGYGGRDTLVGRRPDEIPRPWLTWSNGAPNLLFFSVDPVAIDSVMYDHIQRERDAQEQVAGQTMAPFQEPQLLAGAAAGLGVREHGPPYADINYVEIELGGAVSPTHDVAVTNVAASPTAIVQGGTVNVNVTVSNQGSEDETVNVSVYHNASLIQTQTGILIGAGSSQRLPFTWNTAGIAYGRYRIRAEVSAVTGETDLSDNSYSDGLVTVSATPVHDISVTSVSASPVTVLPGETVNVTVAIRNEGSQSESFTVNAYANTTLIGSRAVVLDAGGNAEEIFSWNTTGSLGLYIITANASIVSGEADTADNSGRYDGAVAVFTHPVKFPTAAFGISPLNPRTEDTITFNAASSSDPDGNIVSYTWDFGDGYKGQGAATTHAYSTAGDFTVTLTVTDNDGLFDVETRTLSIQEKPAQPLLSFELILVVLILATAASVGAAAFLLRRRLR